MSISARIIADSVNPNGVRLITYVLTYPRFIHSEILTHKCLSRNSASSRAMPVQKFIDQVQNEPACPVEYGLNQRGMQAFDVLQGKEAESARELYCRGRFGAIGHAKQMIDLGLHKQIVNRVLEPWMKMTTIVSGTEWGNFFNLRAHRDAQPEFRELAFQMLQCYVEHTPKKMESGEYHLPFADKYLDENLTTDEMIKISVARCARVSYLNFEGDIDHGKDYDLYDRLVSSGHFSPTEHQAECTDEHEFFGNFRGWRQYRKTIPYENQVEFNPEELLKEWPRVQ